MVVHPYIFFRSTFLSTATSLSPLNEKFICLETKLLTEKSNNVEIWARSISNEELDINTAEANEMTDWKDNKNYWLFLNQELPTRFFE